MIAIQSEEFLYPIYSPFEVSGGKSYYAILVYQLISIFNAALLHFGIDCFIHSVLASIVYQTEIVGHRFSRLGHFEGADGASRLNGMKDVVELIKLQFENEK